MIILNPKPDEEAWLQAGFHRQGLRGKLLDDCRFEKA